MANGPIAERNRGKHLKIRKLCVSCAKRAVYFIRCDNLCWWFRRQSHRIADVGAVRASRSFRLVFAVNLCMCLLIILIIYLVNVHMPKDRVTMMHQGYGFVEFMGEEDADYAIKIMNMIKLYGKPIRVNKASAHQKNLDVGANIFIGNLDPEVDEKLLYDTFSAFGVILQTPKVSLLFIYFRARLRTDSFLRVSLIRLKFIIFFYNCVHP